MPIDLSIVIPSYNEAARLPASLDAIAEYFEAGPRQVEVLVVDDGSGDGTGELPLPADSRWLSWRMLHNPGNRGKGYSVRHGMLAAVGRQRLFTDADLSAPIGEITRLEGALRRGADIAIGSRSRLELLKMRQSRFREYAGRIFNRAVRAFLRLPYRDTQCGFKLFTAAAAEAVFPLQRIERWGFDPELLVIARRQGLRVAEVPVVWSHAEGAKIRMFRDSLRMFGDVLTIRRHLRQGDYAPAPQARRAASG